MSSCKQVDILKDLYFSAKSQKQKNKNDILNITWDVEQQLRVSNVFARAPKVEILNITVDVEHKLKDLWVHKGSRKGMFTGGAELP